jgi:hypothetical protein
MPGVPSLARRHPFASSALVVMVVVVMMVVVMMMVMMHHHHDLRFRRFRETSHGEHHCQTKEQTYG